MPRLRNKSTIPQGMLAPNGLDPTVVNPNVQATTRPAGTLLQSSPGYHTIRVGKSQTFQGGLASGGFRPMEFAEDVGGTGAALSVIPGDVGSLPSTEWLERNPDSVPEGSMIIADRGSSQEPTFASKPHQAYDTIPDMGDRHPARPLSRMAWSNWKNPVAMLRKDWAEDPGLTLLGSVAFVLLVHMIGRDLEGNYGRYRGRGLATTATAAPAAVADTTGQTTATAIDDIGKAADSAVERISKAADDAVTAIAKTTKATENAA